MDKIAWEVLPLFLMNWVSDSCTDLMTQPDQISEGGVIISDLHFDLLDGTWRKRADISDEVRL
jgi:hypothetical protein